MKKKQKNKTTISLASLLIFNSQTVLAECTVNGKVIPCDVFWREYGWIFLVMGVVFLLFFGFWLWMLVDCLKSSRKDKLVWTLLMIFGTIIGAILYFFIAKDKNDGDPTDTTLSA